MSNSLDVDIQRGYWDLVMKPEKRAERRRGSATKVQREPQERQTASRPGTKKHRPYSADACIDSSFSYEARDLQYTAVPKVE